MISARALSHKQLFRDAPGLHVLPDDGTIGKSDLRIKSGGIRPPVYMCGTRFSPLLRGKRLFWADGGLHVVVVQIHDLACN